MNAALGTGVGVTLLIALAFVLVFRRMMGSRRRPIPNLNALLDFSAAKYRPMERLFNQGDYEFLAAQPGFNSRIARNLRTQRRRIFRQYLRSLRRDFERIYALAKLLLIHSEQDRPDLAMTLAKLRWTFWWGMAMAQCRLVLPVGVAPSDLRGLLDALNSLANEMRRLDLTFVTSPAACSTQ